MTKLFYRLLFFLSITAKIAVFILLAATIGLAQMLIEQLNEGDRLIVPIGDI